MNISTHDHIAIQRLMYRYASCADHKDYAAFSEVFCEDAVFDYAGTLVTPFSAIQEMMHALDKYFKTQHQVHNVLYEVDGDIATGETYCLASHLIADSEDTKKIDMASPISTVCGVPPKAGELNTGSSSCSGHRLPWSSAVVCRAGISAL